MLEELKKLVDEHIIISFDIFDTLLINLFLTDEDKFDYIEKLKNAEGFKSARLRSENKARALQQIKSNKTVEDISLEEIYNHLDSKYQEFINLEKALDLQTMRKNAEIFEIYNYALAQNKKIIITSDTYYDSKYLTKLLNQNGYSGFSYIFTSNETGKMKATGNLYKHIIQNLEISSDKILHIGDNILADIEKAIQNNISTYHYPSKRKFFLENKINPALMEFYKKYPAYISPILGLQMQRQDILSNYWENLGYSIGGVLCYFFLKTVLQIAKNKNLTDIFFIARDCYIFSKIPQEILEENIPKLHYVYVNRNIKKLYENQENTTNEFKKYLHSISLKGNRIAVVDTCAKTFSAQILIQDYLKEKYIEGIYLSAKNNPAINYTMLTSYDWENFKLFNWNFVEFLLSSPENPIIDIKDNKPVYISELDEQENIRIELYKKLYIGNMKFISSYNKIFKDFLLDIPLDIIFQYISIFWNNMSQEDKQHLSKIKHPVDSHQKTYISIVNPCKDLSDILRARIKNNRRTSNEI